MGCPSVRRGGFFIVQFQRCITLAAEIHCSMKLPKLCCIAILFLLAQPLSAQLIAEDTLLVKDLEAVTVSALRLPEQAFLAPTALSIADTFILKSTTQGLSMNEALASLPGVFVQNSENFAQDLRVSIRGFGARSAFGIRGVKVFTDGIPESTPDGQSQVDNIDPGAMEAVELLRAASGALYGNASGGVLNIATLNFDPGKALTADFSAGSFGFRKFSLSLRNGIAKHLAYHFRASHTKLDGFREHSGMEQWILNAGLKYKLSERLAATLLVNYVNSPLARDPGSITLEQSRADRASAYVNNIEYDAGEAVEQGRLALILKKKLKTYGHLEFKSHYTLRDFENRLPFQNGGAVRLKRSYYGFSLGYLLRKTIAGLPLTGYNGFEMNIQDDDRQRFNNLNGIRGSRTFDQLETFGEAGLFTTWNVQVSAPLSIRATLRYSEVKLKAADRYLADGDDSGERNYERLVPSVNFSYRLNRVLGLFGGFTAGFETPTLNELTNNPLQTGGFNPNLKPQSANTIEAGLRARSQNSGFTGELTLFHINLENEVVPYELEQFPGRTFYRNSGKSSRTGVEASFAAQLLTTLHWSLSYTWSDFKYKDFRPSANDYSGNRQPGVPQHLVWSSLNYAEGPLLGQLQVQYTGKLYANDSNSTEVEPAWVVNARIGYTLRSGRTKISIIGGINNLLDRQYFSNVRINAFGGRYYEPAPGRNLFVRLRFSLLR